MQHLTQNDWIPDYTNVKDLNTSTVSSSYFRNFTDKEH
jgi:hypothetical protein